MKNILFTIFRILCVLVFAGQIAKLFMDFSEQTGRYLNAAMFILIGIAYIVVGSAWEHKVTRMVFTICGLFLIVMNFLDKNMVIDVLGIACILTPMLIRYFHKREASRQLAP